jgi:D-threonate/D-erythronate kinase
MILSTLILADDITGALDSAVGYAGADKTVVVARNPEAVPEALKYAPDVLAINTSSREVSVEHSARQVATALRYLDPTAIGVVLKKIDSRLKGNIGAETEVLNRWFEPARRIACPAIPGMGRYVTQGALEGNGVERPICVASRFDSAVEVPSVTSDADLDQLVRGAVDRVLWIGARGIAFALARAAGVALPAVARLQHPVMIANGSRDPVTQAQMAVLAGQASRIDAPDGIAPEIHSLSFPLVLSISDGGAGISGHEAATYFAASTARLVRENEPAALLICGGESAYAILDQFGISVLQVRAEIRPGLPLCEVQTKCGRVQFVTKSGGFGTPTLLAEVLEEASNQV